MENTLITKSENITSNDLMDIPFNPNCFKKIINLDLSVRSMNCLKNENIIYIGDLVKYTESDLSRTPNFGHKSLKEIIELLSSMELALGMEIAEWPPENIEELSRSVNNGQYNLILSPPVVEEELDKETIVTNYTEMGLFKKVELLGLSVRASNCLQELGVNYVGDLILKREGELLKLPNFGRKTLNELKNSLSEMNLRLGMELRYWPLSDVEEIATQYNNDLAKNDDESLWSAFHRTISNISDSRQLLILEDRLGLKGPIRTLEDIAQELGVTRERVRQIQKKMIQTILKNEFWDDILRIRLKELMSSREFPLYLDSIQEEDKWFVGFENNTLLLQNIIAAFSEVNPIYFLEIDGRKIISNINQEDWREIKYNLLNMLEHSIEYRHTMDDVELFVEDKMLKANAPELTTLLFDQLSKDLNFSFVDGDMILVSVGNSLSSHLRVLLEGIDGPMHFEEIAALYEEKYGVSISTRYVHSSLVGKEFLLFDRGTYGLAKHLKISEQDQKHIIKEIENIIRSGPEKRQWHSRNLVKYFKLEDFFQELNQYTISAVLQKSNNLSYLGKFIWKLKTSEDDDSERLQIKNVVYNILKDAGSPLHIDDIHTQISKVRGIGAYIQLNPNKLFSKIDSSNWGLLERDFILPLEKHDELKTIFLNIFKQRGTALHKTELIAELNSNNLSEEITDTHILGILMPDNRFKNWHGGFVGLSNWISSRRKTFDNVMKEIADSTSDVISSDDVLSQARQLLGYDFNRYRISVYLNKYGMFYDRDSDLWRKKCD